MGIIINRMNRSLNEYNLLKLELSCSKLSPSLLSANFVAFVVISLKVSSLTSAGAFPCLSYF